MPRGKYGYEYVKRDRAKGSFKGWLRNLTRWRIRDQLRKRLPEALEKDERSKEMNGQALEERLNSVGICDENPNPTHSRA